MDSGRPPQWAKDIFQHSVSGILHIHTHTQLRRQIWDTQKPSCPYPLFRIYIINSQALRGMALLAHWTAARGTINLRYPLKICLCILFNNFTLKIMLVNQGFWIMPEILALWRLRQEVHHEFEKKKNINIISDLNSSMSHLLCINLFIDKVICCSPASISFSLF